MNVYKYCINIQVKVRDIFISTKNKSWRKVKKKKKKKTGSQRVKAANPAGEEETRGYRYRPPSRTFQLRQCAPKNARPRNRATSIRGIRCI